MFLTLEYFFPQSTTTAQGKGIFLNRIIPPPHHVNKRLPLSISIGCYASLHLPQLPHSTFHVVFIHISLQQNLQQSIHLLLGHWIVSINLHILEDGPHKLVRRPVTQRPAKSTYAQTNKQHVTKVKRRLHQSMHTRLEDKVIN